MIATAGQDQVSLDWNDNSEPDLAGYNVYRGTAADGPYTKVNGPLVAVSAYTDTGLTGGVTYYYVVRAENTGTQESGNSNESNATPYSTLIAAASADAYVSEQKPNNNYGSATDIIVKSKNNQADRSFVQFDISSIAASSTVNSATLTLCSTSVAGSRTYNAHRVTAAWAEGSVTWGNQPSVAASPTTSATTPAKAHLPEARRRTVVRPTCGRLVAQSGCRGYDGTSWRRPGPRAFVVREFQPEGHVSRNLQRH